MPAATVAPHLTARFREAVHLALHLHQHQLRKSTDIPYAGHVLAVAALVIEHGGTEEQAIAAVLHDAVEDQGGQPTLDMIRRLFGHRVAELVAALSDTDVVPKPPWRERKARYIAHVAKMPEEALLVMLADKLHNARAIVRDVQADGAGVWGRFNAAPRDTAWYYRELASALEKRVKGRLLKEYAGVVGELEQLANKTT